jgi:type IV pilus assembly protein PilY1
MGLVPFTPFNVGGTFVSPVTMYDADGTSYTTNRFNIIGKFQTAEGSGGTPTRETLKYVGDQFNRTDNDGLGNKIVQYACQRNNAFVVTDGFAFANISSHTTPPSYNSATYGGGAPYTTTYASTLADIALSYYTNRLRSDLAAGRVPIDDPAKTNSDQNANLHVNTYGLTLGAKGNIWPANSNAFTNTPTWVNPTSTDRNAIDDLWHASINGRGQMYLATSVEDTTTSMQAALNDILSAAGAQSGVAVSTVNLSRGDGFAYLGTYNPAGWTGDLTANPINANTAVISTTPTWSAGAILLARDWTTRVIASANSSGAGVGFTATDVGGTVNPSSNWGDTAQVMNYLRGDRSLESSTFRKRTSLIGAVINSEPTIDRDTNMVYVASGEGMLHAVDTTAGSTAGKELWAFVPRENLQDMGQTTARHYVFQTQLDGTPVVGLSGTSSKLLVAGMGAAGRSFYAIDVTSPRSYTESQLAAAYKWEFPTAGDTTTRAKVGQSLGRPAIVRTTNNGYVVLVTSGYNSTSDGKGRVWMLNAADGSVIKEFVVNAGTLGAESGLTQVSGFLEDDGTVQYVYGGDLLGNLWRFDLKNQDAPKLVAVLKNTAGTAQPVTAAPELALVQNQRVVLIGTGRILDITDFGNNTIQTFYAIADGDTINAARDSLVQQSYTRTGDVLTSNPVDWATQRGWYMDLPAGEQANTHARISYGAVSFVTNVTGSTDCSASSYLYVLDVASGGKVAGASYVSMQVSNSANASGPTPVASASGQPYDLLQTNDGQAKTELLPSQSQVQASKNSWREVTAQ